jgi:hypothetical protein
MSYVDPHFGRMPRPGAGRHGRQIGWRDKLMGIAFAALVVGGVWWMIFRETGYTVSSLDIEGVVYGTEELRGDTHREYFGYYGQSEVIVIIGFGHKYHLTDIRAQELLAEMLFEKNYSDADVKRFSNALVVCEVSDDCAGVAKGISENAKDRESRNES